VVIQGFVGYRRTGNSGFVLVALALGLQALVSLVIAAVIRGLAAADQGPPSRWLFALTAPSTLVLLAILGVGFWRLGRLPRWQSGSDRKAAVEEASGP
jgi:hypothetical protein